MMVSSSQVGDAIRVRCDDTDVLDRSAAVTSVRAIRDRLVTMTSRNDHSLAIRRTTQDHAGHGQCACATGWLPQNGPLPT